MYAIIETGGKQVKAVVGEAIYVEKLDVLIPSLCSAVRSVSCCYGHCVPRDWKVLWSYIRRLPYTSWMECGNDIPCRDGEP